jgi:hypothetical protein
LRAPADFFLVFLFLPPTKDFPLPDPSLVPGHFFEQVFVAFQLAQLSELLFVESEEGGSR